MTPEELGGDERLMLRAQIDEFVYNRTSSTHGVYDWLDSTLLPVESASLCFVDQDKDFVEFEFNNHLVLCHAVAYLIEYGGPDRYITHEEAEQIQREFARFKSFVKRRIAIDQSK